MKYKNLVEYLNKNDDCYDALMDAVNKFIYGNKNNLDFSTDLIPNPYGYIKVEDATISSLHTEMLPQNYVLMHCNVYADIAIKGRAYGKWKSDVEEDCKTIWLTLKIKAKFVGVFSEFKIIDVRHIEDKDRYSIKNSANKNFIPYIRTEDLDSYATNFLLHYYPEALKTPMPLPVMKIVEKMGLKAVEAQFAAEGVFGQCYFKDREYSSKDGKKYVIPKGTIIYDTNAFFFNGIGTVENTIIHECIHWAYLCELVKRGVYKFMVVPESVKRKWESNIDLTMSEVNDLIDANPQATGTHNRVMTSYMRSLKDQGFLIYNADPKGSKYHIITISSLGKDLIDENKDTSIVYTKVMLGLHANNPSRKAMYNKSRPFLNALFVINRVNELLEKKGKKPKGVLRHEFATFILSMKDCDYEKAAQEIIKYREKFRSEVSMHYINDYLSSNGLLPLKESSICRDYPDDVFRKFEMTGLFMSHGKSKYIYYNISSYNKEKADLILEHFKDYKFETFATQEDYYNYLAKIKIPWETDLEMRRRIAKTKAAYLGRPFNDSIPLEAEELQLDRAFYSHALSKAIKKYDVKLIFKELMILAGVVKEESSKGFKDITESLRLEYLLALAIGKKYGTEGLVSNIIYNEDGEPMHWALGNQCDIMLFREEGSLILEPTMQCTRDQQTRNETTSITRHASVATDKYDTDFRVLMIAPRVHVDTIDYFTYRSARNNLKMVTLTIARTVGLFGENNEYTSLLVEIDDIFDFFMSNDDDLNACADYINNYRPAEKIYQV